MLPFKWARVALQNIVFCGAAWPSPEYTHPSIARDFSKITDAGYIPARRLACVSERACIVNLKRL